MKKLIAILLLAAGITSNAQTKFGVLPFGRIGVDKRISIAKALGVSYVREVIVMQNWKGSDDGYDKYSASGLKVIPNINWGVVKGQPGNKIPVPFPTDLGEYKRILGDILTKYQPPLIVIENEELIRQYHSGPVCDYIKELKAAIEVAHSKGVKVTNGGLTNRELTLLVYRDYLKRGMKDEADDFAKRCIKEGMVNGVKKPGSMPFVDMIVSKADSLIEAYKTLPLDFVNIHIYEPVNSSTGLDESATQISGNAIKEIVDYIKRATGKKVVSNESGTRSSSPELAAAMLDEISAAGLEYFIWFSGDGEGGARALTNDDGSLRPSGEAFKNYVQKHKAAND